MMERLLPSSPDAERGVLGSILIDPEALGRIEDLLGSDDFNTLVHRAIYEAMAALSARRAPADFLTVCEELDRRGTLEEVGGSSYIASLVSQVPTSGNIEYYARIIARTSVLRRLIFAAGDIAATAYEADDEKAALERAESLIYRIGQRNTRTDFYSGEAIAAAYMEKLNWLHDHKGEVLGVPTGYTVLDRITGGFQKTDLIIGAGRPGMGKTSLALNFAYNAMKKHKKRVGIFSLEMSREQLMARLFSMDSKIDSQHLRNGWIGEGDWDALLQSHDLFANDLLWIDDTAGISTMEMRSKARRLQAEHGLDLLIVDYLQLMTATSGGKRHENRVQEISEISRSLKGLAKELNIPVLALSQLSRAVESRQSKVPQLSDLRDGGTIEQDADLVMFVYRDELYAGYTPEGVSLSERPGIADIIVAKHRNGPTGETALRFVDSTTRFYNREESSDV
jgi:replicative DNA helicase